MEPGDAFHDFPGEIMRRSLAQQIEIDKNVL